MIARAMVLVSLAMLFSAAPGPASCTASAQPARTAGVIIQYDELHGDEFCVPLEQGARAIDALTATGLELTINDLGGDRVTVCRIGGVGCERDDCFCACRDAERGCTFWGVYTLNEGGRWTFAQVGVGELALEPGDVIGLRWAVQTPDGGAAPLTQAPQAVCARAPLAGADRQSEGGPGLGVLVVVALAALLGGAAWWTRRPAS